MTGGGTRCPARLAAERDAGSGQPAAKAMCTRLAVSVTRATVLIDRKQASRSML